LTENFAVTPIMDHEAYDYEWLEKQNLAKQKEKEVFSVG
jgi:cytochrome c oxidase subunit 1